MASLAPRWPPGVTPFAALFGFLSGLIIAHVPGSRVGPLAWLYKLSLAIFRSHSLFATVMNLAAVAHAVEALVLAVMSIRRGNKLVHTLGWVAMCLLVGYPSILSYNAEARRGPKGKRRGS